MDISITGLEARNKAIKGLSYVGDVVKATMGPFGLNHLSVKGNKITNDGYIIGNRLAPTLTDEFERRGALAAAENVAKVNDIAGDATSTTWALQTALVKEAVRYLPNDKLPRSKKSPSEIREMIKSEQAFVISELEKMAKPVESKEELIKSALVSVEDEKIAELLGSTQWDLGPDGVITAEEVNEVESSIEIVKGIRIDNGFSTSGIVTNAEKQSLELDNMCIFMTNYTIGVEELQKLNESLFKTLVNNKKFGIVLIARAFTSEAVRACMESLKTGFPIFPVNAPYTYQTEIMHDIEAVVGGRYIDTEESSLDDVFISDVGFAKRIEARQFDAVITGVDDEYSQKRIAARVEKLREKLKGEGSDFLKKMIESRIAQLTTGFAILKVGSYSINDRKRLKDKCDDAVNAVRFALKGGTIRGAGIALKEVADKMEDGSILKRPISTIYEQIIGSAPEGWEVPEWVRDPFLVIKCALEYSCSFAGTFATINSIDTTKDKKECKHEDAE